VATYRLAADQYRAGNTPEAIEILDRVDRDQLKTVLAWLKLMRTIPPSEIPARTRAWPFTQFNWQAFLWDRGVLDAAGMLHIDAAMAAYLTKRDADFAFHTDLAAQLFAIADEPRAGTDEPIGTAGRRSALAIGAKLLGESALGLGERYLATAIRKFPDDVPLLLTFATLLETKVNELVQPVSLFDSPQLFGSARALREAKLKDAASAFERVLAVDSSSVEARIRLAHVRTLEHADAGATLLLNQALAARPPTAWVYLARLMLGGIQQRSGHLESAIQLDRAALAVQPEGQSAYIALSHAMYASGDPESAGRVLDRLFALRLTPISSDPWWDYPFGDWRAADPMLQALRDEARR
jgi:tetratricopeptide (TPR) repeat protein